jgi:hypothetical protein
MTTKGRMFLRFIVRVYHEEGTDLTPDPKNMSENE